MASIFEYERHLCGCGDSLDALLSKLERTWVRQYKAASESATDLQIVTFQGYSFCIDTESGYTVFAHGRSLMEVSFEDLLSQLESWLSDSSEKGAEEREALIRRLAWLRWDHFEAFSRHRKRIYRQAETEIAIGLGLVVLLHAAGRVGQAARTDIDRALHAASGNVLSSGTDWFARWEQQTRPAHVEHLCRTIAPILGSPPVVLEQVLITSDAARCIALMRQYLVPLVKQFATKRPRSRTAAVHYRYPDGTAIFPLDVGHLVAHASGGPPDINFFPQRRDLNRGWSRGGKTYRALERHIAAHPGIYHYCRLIYDGAVHPIPHFIELGIVVGLKAVSSIMVALGNSARGIERLAPEGARIVIVRGLFDNYTGEIVVCSSPTQPPSSLVQS